MIIASMMIVPESNRSIYCCGMDHNYKNYKKDP